MAGQHLLLLHHHCFNTIVMTCIWSDSTSCSSPSRCTSRLDYLAAACECAHCHGILLELTSRTPIHLATASASLPPASLIACMASHPPAQMHTGNQGCHHHHYTRV